MYTEYLSKLNVGDAFKFNGETYTITEKPFGKWLTAVSADNVKRFKTSARVEVVTHDTPTPEDKSSDYDEQW